MSSELAGLADARYVLLSTFRRNGEAVATPVWIARYGDELAVWTERGAGKVKRVRNDSRVELAACDVRGRRTRGKTVTGRARLLDDAGSQQVRDAIARKHGLFGRVAVFFSRLRGGAERTVGLAIAVDEPSDSA